MPMIVMGVLLTLNVPVAYSLLIGSLYYFFTVDTGMAVSLIIQRMTATGESFVLMAIPFFIMSGVIMTYGGISKRLMNFADVLSGHMTGGLAQVNVILSTLNGGCSGSSIADAASECKYLVPEMNRRGYGIPFSGAVTALSATITCIIPPGIGLVLFAFLADVSVGKMFVGGYIPGLMMMAALMIVVHIISKKRGYLPTREKRAGIREIIRTGFDSAWALFMPLGIIMGLRYGVFTPTEAGALCVVYAFCVGLFVYKELKIKDIPKLLEETVLNTAAIMVIIAAAQCFGFYMSWERVPQQMTQVLLRITQNKYLMLFLIQVFLLIVGMLIEGNSAMIILTPLLVPALRDMGVDPIHFGLVMCVNLSLGGCTPPFGSVMFLVCSVLKMSVSDYIKEALPMIGALVLVIFILTFIPGLVLLLPNLVYGT
jgi:tripartite ATP-independent transporter DctM subunit